MSQQIFEIIEEEKKKNYTKLAITPLEQGYGFTLGNSLRRVLLTSLPGAAITSVKIAGVNHQFSSLVGMKEDIVEFCLNLKKVRISYTGEKPVSASLKVTSAGEVKASDIKLPADVEVTNPDLVLAILNKGAKLDTDLTIEAGTGYLPADTRTSNEIGLIPLDASFSPILRVNYKVEETRVGRLTNYDKLTLEVWTDGTIDAKEAVKKAAKTLVEYFEQIVTPKKIEKVKEEVISSDLGLVGKLSVEEIGLPTRVANALAKAGFETVEALAKADKLELVKVRNLGEKSLKIISAALGEKGVSF
ncbi:MAG: DNA-directed RNA polymerase subunit alpha, DNA-directed RNA polymerase subunit alpha [Candidatus Woesebacteria bacterium GW2011_GWF1_31_35]|uniref:DNA-directed RNA polymerase subunit alpha n=1 Tax=Candidatus Woesebacteria bacterium GW2011_GWC2_31_9 TaxID=1618586 RepID=A0A0G0BM71_9BACT|nr:MAG: DNA-directed RNA polymerase subunit alpha, DNA-directed RNA polymerase subunit alpha [Candidatus Woesebacteria bacterium GW2011_GWF1_31_35]KKP23339.1 MAG: DNA-directed RNA polymerase subunit alpha [Candidatus Woesebacteria bacterium GW2011_GWC1_30_29]KKP26143.1 MAG: DNA-directed RNA polymerase subunit alpha [Candidatus Woesebacteria bacterium GW2011_GWD1_31_12]KKP27600.1 MAG: DNA-directed RNA polymerase subunit alpha [Candidatus Woesebacteria bacterium GW2011_GWB1_31_29]KKP30838.1 MAG: 